MSAPEQAESSPVKELEKRLGVQWLNLSEARNRAAEKRERLQGALADQSNDDISIFAFGSLARGEFTENSDRRYLEEDGTFSRANTRYLVPRFLLNDIARYWRTMAVDFAYKRKSRFGKGAALRNLKLRMSRKLIYASGLLTCFGCELGLRKQPPCKPPQDTSAATSIF